MLSLPTVIILLVGWVAWLAVLGRLVAGRATGQSVDDYLVAGRSVPWGLICTSVVAAYIWSATLMASAEGAYAFGAAGLWIYGLGYGTGLSIFGLGAQRLRSIFPKGTTIHQFVRLRFDSKTQVFWAALGIAFSVVTVMIQLIGSGIAIETFTGGRFPFWIGPLLVCGAVLLYLVAVGLWAAIAANFVMVIVAVVAAVWLAPWTIAKAGGLATIYEAFTSRIAAENANYMANFFQGNAMVNYLIPVLAWSYLTLWLQQDYWQYVFASEPRTIRKSFGIAGLWWACIPMAAASVGLAGWALKVQVSVASDIYPRMVSMYLPPWVQAIFLLMIFAAVTSTTAGSVMAVSGVLLNDFYAGYINRAASQAQLNRIAKWLVAIVTVILGLLSLQKVSILNLLLFMSLLLSAPAPAIITGMLSGRLSPNGAFIASLAGMALGLYVYFGTSLGLGIAIITAFATSLAICLIFSAFYDYKFDFSGLREVRSSQEASGTGGIGV